jgi:hypothetical protein
MALGVSAYSETPFAADPSDVIAYPSGINLSAQTGNFVTQGNANVDVTGISISPTVGQAGAFSLVIVSVTGVSASIVSGNEDAFTDITVQVTSAGKLNVVNQIFTQDTLTAFGEAPFATQSPSTFTAPNVIITGTANIIPTSIALNVITGNEDTEADANVPVTGNNLITGAGQVFAGALVDVSVTGISLSIDLGTSVITPNTIAQITGQSLNTQIGIVDPSPDAMVTGVGVTAAIGIGSVVIGTANVDVTGIQLTASLGTPLTLANADVEVTGSSLSSEIGIVDPSPDAMVTGVGVTAVTGIGSVIIGTANVDVTGIQLTASLGTPLTLANADVEVTGSSLNTFIGEETIQANANVDVTGSSITGVVGDITPISTYSVTGIGISAVIDSVVVIGTANVPVTGSDLTVNTISPNIIAWAEVDTGTPVTWTTVDLAA